jgi:hypothetical protein
VPALLGAFIASSLRNGSHSISAAIGSLISANSSTIDIHSDISFAMLLLLCENARRKGSGAAGRGSERLQAVRAIGRMARAGRA